VLLVSGTASIVGHAAMFPDNVVAPTRETMTNIKAVLAEENRLESQPRFDPSNLYYKVYVRQPADLAQIRAELEHRAGGALKVAHLQAHVCRQDQVLEIGTTAAHPVILMSGQRS
jgi:chorismate lyase / 3-hydroxybenzoate synthase